MELNKKQIKRIVRRLTYFDNRLNILQGKVDALSQYNYKQLRRFEKEAKIVSELFQVYIYNTLPKSYDILENPKQKLTKIEFLKFKSGIATMEAGFIDKSGYRITYSSIEAFKMYQEIYKELSNK